MGSGFSAGAISVTATNGEVWMLNICAICGASVIEAEGAGLAFHQRWHRTTGSGNWHDSVTGRILRVE
ncbi:hypothetical protein GCM10027515_04160 [Schumannella luteola]|uniref:Uncharacterized protein n=1 Tax=Schumannella luteola TaxID=472059 RepID=A0A852YHB1_9MICO|nr:histidine ammonia-lyase [Schumannella luteola]NYG98448.1 hypothetical protein [Schumannella luteola]TPX01320.1 histidine ammonia-lyase [Schumannella luteola]